MAHNEIESKYNPKSIMDDDFEQHRFSDIDVNMLFWLHTGRDNNHAYRKLDDNSAQNTITRNVERFSYDTVVYERN
jgi:hypothetical protein